MSITAYPLSWPTGWKRTAPGARTWGRFGAVRPKAGRAYPTREQITIGEATNRLLAELERMGVDREDVVLSTNLVLRLDGLPRSGQAAPSDPGAAVYWPDPWSVKPRCMAIDRYTKVEQNIAALAATIEAMRAIERHGGAVVLERAFTGFSALPAPIVAGMKRDWREVLEIDRMRPAKAEEINAAYRRLAARHHPDRGGDTAKMSELNAAREEALDECKQGGAA